MVIGVGGLLFAFAFPVGLIFTISRLSGWNRLAERFPRTGQAPKPLTIFGYAVFRRWVGYNGGLIVAADDAGLYLSAWPVVFAFHKPVFVPWREIASATARRVFWRTYYALELPGAPGVELALAKRAFDLVRPWFAKAGVPVVELPKA